MQRQSLGDWRLVETDYTEYKVKAVGTSASDKLIAQTRDRQTLSQGVPDCQKVF